MAGASGGLDRQVVLAAATLLVLIDATGALQGASAAGPSGRPSEGMLLRLHDLPPR